MRAFKYISILVAVIIVAGFAFIAWEVFQRATNPDHPRSWAKRGAEATAAGPASAALPPAPLPVGSRIGQMVEANGRVVFHVTLPDGREELHLLDPRAGTSRPVVQSGDAASIAQPLPAAR